jgi:hypothetical protein
MKRVMLAIDAILEALIGPGQSSMDRLIEQAKNGETELVVQDFALYCALRSVHTGDAVNITRLAELLKYARIEISPYLGPEERNNWEPNQEEIENWRRVILQKD